MGGGMGRSKGYNGSNSHPKAGLSWPISYAARGGLLEPGERGATLEVTQGHILRQSPTDASSSM